MALDGKQNKSSVEDLDKTLVDELRKRNPVQADALIEAAKIIVEGFNRKSPNRDNLMAIQKLDEAILWLNKKKTR